MGNIYKITPEQFNKLSQLDRIEFRQKRDWIEHNKINVGIGNYFMMMLSLIAFVMLFAVCAYNIDKELTPQILKMIPLIVNITIAVIIIGTILQVLFNYADKRMKDKLFSEYFTSNIEVKKK